MIKCIAIDDEPLALKQMAGYILKTPFLELVGRFESAIQAIPFVQENQVDLMFLDISMPDLSGIDFVKSLEHPPKVVFTTAFSDFAVEGFRVDAVDYLVKPIGYSDFLKAANKAKSWFETKLMAQTQVKYDDQFLFIKSEYRIVRINFNDIRYIEAMSEYVKIHLTSSSPVMSLLSMKSLENQLPADRFMRVHRSFIVNLTKITVIERNRIVFGEDIYIPVSDQYKSRFQSWVDKNFII